MPEQPLIAIDVVPVRFTGDGLDFGTITRALDPFAGAQALPGVLLGAGERLEGAARRALTSKAAVDGSQLRHLAQIRAFDSPGRDPRSSAISIAFLAILDPGTDVEDDAPRIEWSSERLRSLDLPFDHDLILDDAREYLRTRLWSDVPMTAALTGPVFSTSDAARLEEALTGLRPEPGNFHRTLSKNPGLTKVDAWKSSSTVGRPASGWRWELS